MSDGPQSLPGLGGMGQTAADEVADLAAWLESLDPATLQGELKAAAATEAKVRAEHAAALEARAAAAARGDRQAEAEHRATARVRNEAVRVATARVQAMRAELRARREPAGGAQYEPEELPERFVDLEDFMVHFFLLVIERKLGPSRVWCPRWWAHPEAVNRLWALWRSYEAFRAQGGSALTSWWVYHVDSQLPQLLDEHGPFARCRKGHERGLRPLGHEPVPEGWWDVTALGEEAMDVTTVVRSTEEEP